MVVHPPISQVESRLAQGAMERLPRFDKCSIHSDRTTTSVQRIAATVDVVFQADEGGQHLPERPPATAAPFPEIEVLGYARMAA